MRKITWIILILIVLVWVAIAIFWTGTKTDNNTFDFPEAAPTISEEIQPPISSIPLATSSADATPTASKLTTPSGNTNLNY